MSNGYNRPPSSHASNYQYAPYYMQQERRASSQRPPPPQYGAHATYNSLGAAAAPAPAPPPAPPPPPVALPPSMFGAYAPSYASPSPFYTMGYETRNVQNAFAPDPRAMAQMQYQQHMGGAYWDAPQQRVQMSAAAAPVALPSGVESGARMRCARMPKSLEQVRNEAMEQARVMFKKFDVDDGGYLDLQEFMDAFRALKLAITYHEAMACFQSADQNEDGRISEEEFVDTYATQMVRAELAAAAAANSRGGGARAGAAAGAATVGGGAARRHGSGSGGGGGGAGMAPARRPAVGP